METLLGVLERGEAGHAAVVATEGPALTYAALRREVTRAADRLAALGIERGDRVALALPNGAEALVMFLAAATAATAAPLNPAYTEEEFRFYMEDTGARALVVPPGSGEAARKALPEGALLLEAQFDGNGTLRVESASRSGTGRTAGAPSGEDVALVLHTSGTTSRPKRVPLRHRNLAASAENIVRTYALAPEDVSLCLMPLFHVHGLVASALAALRAGGTVVVPPRFHPLGFRRLLREHRVTWYSAVPTIHQLALARAGEGERIAEAATLRFIRSCSAALPPATMAQMEAQFGTPVLEAYGMTEASHQIASNPLPPGARRPGSVGVGTGVQVAALDEAGAELPPGTPGEVAIQGPNVTGGYENNPEANAASFTNGWFRTGDLGTVDDGGYVTLLGRLKELINYGGEKISPREVDEVLLLHPAVAEAVCFGAPHPVWGEVVEAAVVLRAPAGEGELARHCGEHLADFKIPKQIHVVETIPRTATGKIQRRHVAAAIRG